ncbi:TadE/TadG family type IV pilus assembly protein [Kocuria rosea]|uniref:TadE/TadG family type IV pilus assembly protein n=1 Tax=Kocuria rosea TaxID=1275 RepID=UPI0025400316|nr:TadE/TadG family type IV pilus assembly protein [Kocuria rosea]WIG18504.1 TadE/TadG family type IV pilus assembly protein [Kocuria rosea]
MDEERARPGAGPPETDRGSAVVEYVMVAGLVAMIFAATLQLALALHVRNTLIDAAAAGARYGTLADRTPEDGVERTRRIVSGALGPRYAQDVVATTAAVGELRTLEITVVSPLPVVALFGPPDSLEVRGHAVLGD